jgi:hypothetical protein
LKRNEDKVWELLKPLQRGDEHENPFSVQNSHLVTKAYEIAVMKI